MLGYAAESSGESLESIEDRLAENEETRLFAANVATAAFDTTWEPKIRALGRLLANGVIDMSGGVWPLRTYVLPAMMAMEQPDVALLDVLGTYVPDPTRDPPGRLYRDLVAESTDSLPSTVREWSSSQIVAFRPQHKELLPGLLGTLTHYGLAVQNDISARMTESYLATMRTSFNFRLEEHERFGRKGTPKLRMPSLMQQIDATWSVTELGELVLQIYIEAGATSIES